jgi:hypothetical protein
MGALSKVWTVFGRSNAGIVGSNHTQGMDDGVRLFSVLFCVYVAALQRADPPSKESYRLCIGLTDWKIGQRSKKGFQNHRQYW